MSISRAGCVRRILAVGAAGLVVSLLVGVAPVSAKPVPGGLLDLPSICTSASMKMAELIDAKLVADKALLRMILADQPKKGETGYVDGTVYHAMLGLAVTLKKAPEDITETDIANNQADAAAAIAAALAYREKERNGSFTLEQKDGSGNMVQLWCLKATADHRGPHSGLLYVSAVTGKPADGVWIGGSSLANGFATFRYSYDDDTDDFVVIIAEYYGADPATPGRHIKLSYLYAPGGNISIWKEYGPLNDKGEFVPDPKLTEEQLQAPAPAELKDLRLNGQRVGLLESEPPDTATAQDSTATTTAPTERTCRAVYTIIAQWPGGFQGEVGVIADTSAITGWSVVWTVSHGQTINQLWNATATSSESTVTARNVGYNGSVPANATTTFGFLGSWDGTNFAPRPSCTAS